MAAKKKLKITQLKGIKGIVPKHKACMRGLGLRRRHHTVILQDDPCIRGMINQVRYLIVVEEV